MPERTPAEQLAHQILHESREEVTRADGKAATLLGFLGVVVSVVIAGIVAGDWSPKDLDNDVEWLWWIGTALIGGSLIALAHAVFPKLRSKHAKGHVTYFGHVREYRDAAALRDALGHQADLNEREVEQLKVISDVAWMKYRSIQVALWLAGAGFACVMVSVLLP